MRDRPLVLAAAPVVHAADDQSAATWSIRPQREEDLARLRQAVVAAGSATLHDESSRRLAGLFVEDIGFAQVPNCNALMA